MNTHAYDGTADTSRASLQIISGQLGTAAQRIRFRSAWCLLSILCLVVFATACATPESIQAQRSNAGIAVMGVTAAAGLDVAFNRNVAARDLTELLASRGSYSVLPASSVRQFLGPARVDGLLSRYAIEGQITPPDMQMIMAAGLTTRRALIARIEDDFVVQLPARREPVFNRAGATLVDRERRILGTQRTTRISATLIDLQTGRQLWSQQYQVDPVVEVASTHYLGSSFSGSLAAAFANTVINGVRVARYPDAPSLRVSLQTLLRQVTEDLP